MLVTERSVDEEDGGHEARRKLGARKEEIIKYIFIILYVPFFFIIYNIVFTRLIPAYEPQLLSTYYHHIYVFKAIALTSLLIFIGILIIYFFKPLSTLRILTLVSAIPLIISNYGYVASIALTRGLSVYILPLTFFLISNEGNTALSLDWGQLAVLIILYMYRKRMVEVIRYVFRFFKQT